MSVIERLNRLVRANLNDFISRGAGRGALMEVKRSLSEARAQLIECRATEKRLAQEYEGYLDEALSWEERAMLALRAGDEPLARKALQRKYQVEKQAREVKRQLDDQRAYMVDLSRSLDAIEVKLEAVREHSRVSRGQEGRVGEVGRGVPPVGPRSIEPQRLADLEAEAELGRLVTPESFTAFDDMASRISRAEAETEALRELDSSPTSGWEPTDAIDARFRELEIKRDMDRLAGRGDALSDLRRLLDEE
ncbi:MAG: PspA/IM30 family protein [Bradymonadales bacterium]|nr:PspA/IM30 family protein [Bradymonadales bacterium]